jgi:hypothetical protein
MAYWIETSLGFPFFLSFFFYHPCLFPLFYKIKLKPIKILGPVKHLHVVGLAGQTLSFLYVWVVSRNRTGR